MAANPPIATARSLLARLAAIAAGIAVPMAQIGIGLTTTLLAVACAAIAFCGDLAERLRDVHRLAKSPAGVAVVLMFLLWLPGLPGSIDPAKSVEVWLRMTAYLGLGALLWSFLRSSPASHELTVKALVAAALLTAVLAAVNFLGMEELIRAIRLKGWRSGVPSLAMKHYASAAACLVPVLVLAAMQMAGRWRAMAGLAAAGLVAFIFLTHGDAALLGLGAGAALAGVSWRLGGRRLWATATLCAGIAALLLGLLWLGSQPIGPERKLESFPLPTQLVDPHRQTIWKFALDRVPEAPWLGHGIDGINKVRGADAAVVNPKLFANGDIAYFEQTLMPSHPHNWLLEVVVESGAVGLAGVLGAIVTLFWSILPAGNRQPDAATHARTALFGTYFGASLANFSFWASWWQIVFIALWAILAATPAAREIQPRPRPIR